MPSVANETTMGVLRDILEKQGYALNPPVHAGDSGADIIARRGGDEVVVEVIGLKANLSNRGNAFYKAFFQALTRIASGSGKVAIAVPVEFESGIVKRAADRKTAWKRLGDAFPELEIWLVDTTAQTCRFTRWNDWVLQAPPTT